MRSIDIIRISIKMLRTNFLRTLLTVLGISLAIGLIVVLTGVGYGIQDITIGSIVKSKSLLSIDVTPGVDNVAPLNMQALQTIQSLPGVSDASPVLTTEGQVTFNSKLISNTMQAVVEKYFTMEGITLTQGRYVHDGAGEIVLSPPALSLLDTTPEAILNHTIDFKFIDPATQKDLVAAPSPLTVVGITDGKDTDAVFVPFSLVQNLTKSNVTTVKVVAKNRDDVITATNAIKAKGYSADSLIDTLDSATRVFHWVTFVLIIIALIALLVAAIGMFNTLTITLLERTREIGIMKAIGLTDTAIKKLFLTEAIFLGLLGGLLGVGSGLIASLAVNQLINFLASHYGGTAINLIRFPAVFLPSMLLYPVLLAIITGLYPAIRAARLNPLRALRYE